MKIALYRKYRPNSLKEVVGQEYVVEVLKNAILKQKVGHAYIFSGPKGSGKTSVARIFAGLLSCEQNETADFCEKCAFCLNNKNSADIIEIDAASNNGVDEIRDLRSNCELLPTSGKYKIYIIDEVHMLSNGAFNALLKILEEPPKHIIFIFATTEFYKLPATVISRAQRFEFKKIPVEQINLRLKEVAELEKIKISDEIVKTIAELADGSLRDGLSILDQISNVKKIDEQTINQLLGVSSHEFIKQINLHIVNKNYNELMKSFEEVEQKNINIDYLISRIIKLNEDILNALKDDYIALKRQIEYIKDLNQIMNVVAASKVPVIMFKCLILEKIIPNDKITQDVPKSEVNEDIITNVEEVENLDIRKQIIDNALSTANKKIKTEWNNRWNAASADFTKKRVKFLSETTIAIASEKHLIFQAEDNLKPQLQKNRLKINKIINQLNGQENRILFLNEQELVDVKNYYLLNKNTIVYKEVENYDNNTKLFEDILEVEE